MLYSHYGAVSFEIKLKSRQLDGSKGMFYFGVQAQNNDDLTSVGGLPGSIKSLGRSWSSLERTGGNQRGYSDEKKKHDQP